MGDVEKEGEGGSRVLSVGTACAKTSAGSVPKQHLLSGPGDPFLVCSVCTQKWRLSLAIPAENINAPASAWGRGHAPRKSPQVTSSCLAAAGSCDRNSPRVDRGNDACNGILAPPITANSPAAISPAADAAQRGQG